MELKDTISIMNNLSGHSSSDELPILDLLSKPFHEMSEEQKKAFVEEVRAARVNTNVLVNRIEREVKPKATTNNNQQQKAKPKLDVSDLI